MELQVPKVAPERTSASDGRPYIDFCNSVQDDESGELLKDFRRNPDYDLVVPGKRNGAEVLEFVELVKNEYAEMLPFLPMFSVDSGTFGNPTTYGFDFGEAGVFHLDVPLPLHIFYLALTRRYFGDLSNMHVCEIGPGAGLMFKMFTELYPATKYTFVDLPAPLYLNRKHVEWLQREHNVEEYLPCWKLLNEDIDREYDLVMSDCAFNELHRDVQSKYVAKIFNKSTRGRIAFYDSDMNTVLPSMNINEVFGILEKETKTIQTDLRVPTLYWDETKKERNTDATPDADD